jgi:hypothetical protein
MSKVSGDSDPLARLFSVQRARIAEPSCLVSPTPPMPQLNNKQKLELIWEGK